LFKIYRQLISSTQIASATDPTIAYLKHYLANPKCNCPVKSGGDFFNPEIQLQAFGYRAAHMIAAAVDQLDNNNRNWNSMLVDIAAISRAHSQYVLVRNFIEGLQPSLDSQNDRIFKDKTELHSVLKTQCNLFVLHTMQIELADFLSSGHISSSQSRLLKEQVLLLLKQVRPNAVALVDSFNFSDFKLQSALGRYDGKVYETLCDWASREPLNRVTLNVNPSSDVLFREDEIVSKL
jgi:acyl-CoA oxidase